MAGVSLAVLLVYVRFLEDQLASYEAERVIPPGFEPAVREAWSSDALLRQGYTGGL